MLDEIVPSLVFVALNTGSSIIHIVAVTLTHSIVICASTWRLMGNYRWGYKQGRYTYNPYKGTYNPTTYNYP